MEDKSGGYSERRKIESIFKKVATIRRRFFSKKGSDANLYRQRSSRELLEKKYSIQGIDFKI
jgi:hypothetical protein